MRWMSLTHFLFQQKWMYILSQRQECPELPPPGRDPPTHHYLVHHSFQPSICSCNNFTVMSVCLKPSSTCCPSTSVTVWWTSDETTSDSDITPVSMYYREDLCCTLDEKSTQGIESGRLSLVDNQPQQTQCTAHLLQVTQDLSSFLLAKKKWKTGFWFLLISSFFNRRESHTWQCQVTIQKSWLSQPQNVDIICPKHHFY